MELGRLTNMATVAAKWKRNAVLPEEIGPVIEKRWVDGMAERAHVDLPWLYESAKDWCSPAAVRWMALRLNNQDAECGFILGPGKVSEFDVCMCLAAACFRYEKTGRVMLRDDVLQATSKDELPDIFGIFVPDFYVEGYGVTDRQQQLLYKFLAARRLAGHSTVVYVDNLTKMVNAYGTPIGKFLAQQYRTEKTLT